MLGRLRPARRTRTGNRRASSAVRSVQPLHTTTTSSSPGSASARSVVRNRLQHQLLVVGGHHHRGRAPAAPAPAVPTAPPAPSRPPGRRRRSGPRGRAARAPRRPVGGRAGQRARAPPGGRAARGARAAAASPVSVNTSAVAMRYPAPSKKAQVTMSTHSDAATARPRCAVAGSLRRRRATCHASAMRDEEAHQLHAEPEVAPVDDVGQVLVVEDLVVDDVVLTEAAAEHGRLGQHVVEHAVVAGAGGDARVVPEVDEQVGHRRCQRAAPRARAIATSDHDARPARSPGAATTTRGTGPACRRRRRSARIGRSRAGWRSPSAPCIHRAVRPEGRPAVQRQVDAERDRGRRARPRTRSGAWPCPRSGGSRCAGLIVSCDGFSVRSGRCRPANRRWPVTCSISPQIASTARAQHEDLEQVLEAAAGAGPRRPRPA